jgi:hypothetical protein
VSGPRIIVIGTSGAGKTTLAGRISARLGIEHVEPPLWTILTDRDHIIRWAWRTRHTYDDVIGLLARERPGLPVVRLRSQAEADAWLASLRG